MPFSQAIGVIGHAYVTSQVFQHIAQSYLKVGALEWIVFKHLRTAERINRRWDYVARLLKLG